MLNKFKKLMNGNKKSLEVNKNEINIIEKSVLSMVDEVVFKISCEDKMEEIPELISEYNNYQRMLNLVVEEKKEELGEISFEDKDLELIKDSLEVLEFEKSKELKREDIDAKTSRMICKSLYIVSGLLEKLDSVDDEK